MYYSVLLGILLSAPPNNGLYTCVQGNNDSICDQAIRVTTKLGEAVEIRVMYEGECNGQGPYTYECEENICTNGAIQITFESPNRYRWQNLSYGFSCEMEKKI